ncbi:MULTISPECIES: Mor transcription activator family protein [Citrobacter]|uniref:Mor transcription activator family protein n=1 Tax=Citrobacter TaxID=544 RepID=UPI001680AA55|nr:MULTISPECIES: Mor transcription activator family protein [Citrobacter]MCK7561583.1 hypothetical protein [Citrobacter koseri]MDM2952811.1 hypothetical protein [Citrobacter sp. CK203]MDM3032006.1 hypothetical protein [Citrobacter sp. CK186]BCL49824.1 hypothetical protein MPUCK001_36420 [Citrobacter koseri]
MNQYHSDDLERVKALLPETVLHIAELIGFPATAALLKAFGGSTFPIGKGLRALGVQRVRLLHEAVGEENALILMKNLGGERVYLPRCDAALRKLRNMAFLQEFDALRNQGTSSLRAMTELCPKYGFSDRFAWELVSMAKSADDMSNQTSLF